MASDEVMIDQNYKLVPMFPSPFTFCTNLLSLQAEIISTCILSLASPFFSIISHVSDFLYRRPPDAGHYPIQDDRDSKSDTSTAAGVVGGGGSLLLGRIAVGMLAAAYVCAVLMAAMVVAAVLGVWLVSAWAEQPIYVREGLRFDYAEDHPTAVFYFGTKAAGVPVGHTLHVSLLLLMPESDYNRDLGIFQLTAELISLQGDLVAKTSIPCMLRFRSWPVRLARTFLMGVPLLLGITTETQTIAFPILKHTETLYPRTDYIRVTLIPRAGTASIPQFYNAEVVVNSRPPWTKAFVYRWKWTFYVWTTLHIFLMLVMVLVFFLKPLIFPVMVTPLSKYEQESTGELASPEPRDEREVSESESVKRLQRSRSKRTTSLLHGAMPKTESKGVRSSAATSITVTREESGAGFEEGSGDSESVCFRGFR